VPLALPMPSLPAACRRHLRRPHLSHPSCRRVVVVNPTSARTLGGLGGSSSCDFSCLFVANSAIVSVPSVSSVAKPPGRRFSLQSATPSAKTSDVQIDTFDAVSD